MAAHKKFTALELFRLLVPGQLSKKILGKSQKKLTAVQQQILKKEKQRKKK